MSTRASYGWADEQPCPAWCTTGAQHLTTRLRHRMDDWWHEGVEHDHATLDTDHNWHPIDLPVHLGQQERENEHGRQLHPVYVDCGGHTLSPAQARALAATLLILAHAAEQPGEAPCWRQQF